jgi:hypothetical protein
LAVGQIELTWVQNGPLGYEKIQHTKKKKGTHCIMIILCRGGFQEHRKIGKIVTVQHRELFKKRLSLGTFCIQAVFQGIM